MKIKNGVLSEPNMRWYLGGQLVSLTGTMLQSAVLSLLIMTLRKEAGKTDAAYWVGLVWAFGLAPGIFLGPFAGILLDRWDKRKILIVTGVLGTCQAFTLACLTYTGHITVLVINILAVLMGVVNAIDGPGRNVIVKDAVLHKHNVRQASKMFTSLYNLAQVAGPGFAGLLVLRYGYPFTFVLNGLSFVVLIVALCKMKLVPKILQTASVELEKKGTWKLVNNGAAYILSEPSISICILLTGILCTFGFSYYAILAVIARDMFGGNPIVYSHLAVASGAGSFLGALIVIKFDEELSHKMLVLTGTVLLGMGLIALSRTSNVNMAMVFLFLMGASFMVSFSTLRSSIIHLAKSELSGIVMGFAFSFFYGGFMFGSYGAGYVANRWSCSSELAISGCIMLMVGIVTPILPGIQTLDR